MSIAEKMRRARERPVEFEGRSYTVRIPTPGELEDLYDQLAGKRMTARRVALAFLCGWNLQEIDLIPGGSPVAVPCDADVAEEWMNGKPALVDKLFAAITEGMESRKKEIEDAKKN